MFKPPMQPLRLFLKTVPNAVHSEMLSRLFNHLLKGQWMTEQLVDLEGKRLAILIKDTRTQLLFAIRDGRFYRQPVVSERSWDVRISGDLQDFWLLASRAEDPDTLFFNRRLAIEGETETGLYIKNLLDAMDFDLDAHLNAVFGPRLAIQARKVLKLIGLEKRIHDFSGQPQF